MISDMASRANGGSGQWARPWLVTTIILVVLVGVGALGYYEFTSTASPNAVGRYGAVGIPGKATLQLPAVPAFGISVVSASTGQQLDVRFSNGSASSVNGVSYAPVGTVQIPRAGKYDVDITGTDTSAPNPQLQFGTSTAHGLPHVAFGVAGVVVLLCLVLPWWLHRRASRRPAPMASGTDVAQV
jgi:hypothetical protein